MKNLKPVLWLTLSWAALEAELFVAGLSASSAQGKDVAAELLWVR